MIGSFDKIVVLNKNRAGSRVYQTKINTTCHAVTRWQVSCNLKQQLTRSLARVRARVCLSTVQWKINEHRNPPQRLTEWIDKKVANNYRYAARRWHAIFWLQCRTQRFRLHLAVAMSFFVRERDVTLFVTGCRMIIDDWWQLFRSWGVQCHLQPS